MKKIHKLIPVLFLLTVFVATSCLKDDNTNPNVPVAALRMVNAYTHSDAIVFTDEHNYITPPNSPLGYNEYTRTLALFYPGNRRIKVYAYNNKLISDTTVTLKDSTYYTSFVFGDTDKAKNLIATDNSIADLGTKAAFRFLHLASNIGNVNVYINSTNNPIYSNRAPEVVTGTAANQNTVFAPQASGKQNVIITDTNNNILIQREYDFSQKGYYSILLSGDKKSTTKPLYLGIIKQ